jgi:hypothetical protein
MSRRSKAVRTFRPRVTGAITAATLITLAGVSGATLTTPAEAASSGAVINEVYGIKGPFTSLPGGTAGRVKPVLG